MSRCRQNSYVYFVQVGEDGPIKIGLASHPGRRLSALQAANPYNLYMRAVCGGGIAAERRLHEVFAKDRIRLEWFNPSPGLTDLIRKLPSWDQVNAGAFLPEVLNPDRTIMEALFMKGFSFEDIGELYGVTKQAVGQRLNLGKTRQLDRAVPTQPIKEVHTTLLEEHADLDILLPGRQ